ncbi:NAD-dependent protein deacetylase sirtuin-7 isoform X2 [Folsomia candida]|uniref:NAD-dependent protein deacetylase sirtuin-7 isoform X2 n=1 Tax=Folsomia candida TaxID=158441 RepID=UPI0016053FFF|nr:NAD-dependent protein deacetylase sirtuin-7 isoform X2 [Folsomia candida]
MDNEVKPPNPSPPFRFRRPWETPPREDEEQPTSNPTAHAVPITVIKREDYSSQSPIDRTKDVLLQQIKVEKEESSDEVEVFSFDRERLVLTSEKVRVKRESTSTEITNSPLTSSSIDVEGSASSKQSSGNSNSSSSRFMCSSESSSGSSSSDSDDRNRRRKNKLKTRLRLTRNKARQQQKENDDKCHKNDARIVPPPKSIKVKVEIDPQEAFDDDEIENDELLDVNDSNNSNNGRNRERKNSRWADYGVTRKSSRLRSTKAFCNKSHKAQVLKKLTSLLKKDPDELTEEDRVNLAAFPELAEEAKKRLNKRHLASERMKEEEDPSDQLDKKCDRLAQVISRAKYVVLYTGAGISTSASIPDYRGPNGIWTLLRKGQTIADDLKQFPQSADPTFTHMAIKELYERGMIKHIVSQNVDGLHLRSGIPKTALSEVHGNMYIEVCLECHREYVRLFDVTENTKRHHHKTGRYCYHCGTPLKDSVVLFGEKGSLRWPINWAGAEYNVDKADVILCLGSSLKVLRRYPWLWCMSKPVKQRPKLYIVNLQWTPKDRFAALKINGRCDEVIAKIMDNLSISVPIYKRELDPIFSIATLLHSTESSTKLSKDLNLPDGVAYPQKSTDLCNYFRFEPVFCKEVRSLNEVKRKVVDGEKEAEKDGVINPKTKFCGIGWLGNALSGKPKKKKVKS